MLIFQGVTPTRTVQRLFLLGMDLNSQNSMSQKLLLSYHHVHLFVGGFHDINYLIYIWFNLNALSPNHNGRSKVQRMRDTVVKHTHYEQHHKHKSGPQHKFSKSWWHQVCYSHIPQSRFQLEGEEVTIAVAPGIPPELNVDVAFGELTCKVQIALFITSFSNFLDAQSFQRKVQQHMPAQCDQKWANLQTPS